MKILEFWLYARKKKKYIFLLLVFIFILIFRHCLTKKHISPCNKIIKIDLRDIYQTCL
jgi:hypothetical protein